MQRASPDRRAYFKTVFCDTLNETEIRDTATRTNEEPATPPPERLVCALF